MLLTSAKHKSFLVNLEAFLTQEGWDVDFTEGNPDRPYDALILELESLQEESPEEWVLELAFLPTVEEELQPISILQFYVPLLAEVAQDYQSALSWLILKFNTKLPLVGFGFLEEYKLLYFKTNTMIIDEKAEMSYKIINETLFMISYLLTTFSHSLVQVAIGETNVEEAIQSTPFSNIYNRLS